VVHLDGRVSPHSVDEILSIQGYKCGVRLQCGLRVQGVNGVHTELVAERVGRFAEARIAIVDELRVQDGVQEPFRFAGYIYPHPSRESPADLLVNYARFRQDEPDWELAEYCCALVAVLLVGLQSGHEHVSVKSQ